MAHLLDTKEAVAVESVEEAVTWDSGTAQDQYDMTRMGKKQELRRNFQFLSMLAFTVMIVNTWATTLYTISYGLINGGLAGLVWMFLVSALGMGATVLSVAEMASMAPTSGGQYHWASEFAPLSIQKPISYLTGWLSALAWQTGIASAAYIMANQIQAMLLLNNATYEFQRWHGTLLIIGIASLATISNCMLVKVLPKIEIVMLVLYFAGFFGIVITLWVLAPKTSAQTVFTVFQNNGGWPSQGLSVLIGLTGPMYTMIAFDCGVHLGEEIKDSSRTLPRAIVWAFALTSLSGFIMLLTFCFSVGDIEEAVNSPTGQPYIQVFFTATKSYGGATAMAAILTLLTFFNALNNVASASRQLFAFARDKGVPFSPFLSHVSPRWALPMNAILVTYLIACLLSLINIGSSVAYNAIVSLGAAALLTTYFVTIACVLLKRVRGESLRPRRWSLGRWGAPINVVALLFLSIAFFFSFWPLFTPTTAMTFNWSVVIYAAVLLFAGVYYAVIGRHQYDGPVVLVRKDL